MGTIILQNLSKTYPNGKQAVRNITLSLKQGTVFGFLGPNGAGKTTTVKLLTGILTPTSGHCLISGNDPSRSPKTVHALAGVVTEHAQMYDSMTGLENLSFYASIFGISKKEGHIDFSQSPDRIERSVRAFDPWPGTYAYLGEKMMKIWQAEDREDPTNAAPGTILAVGGDGIDVAAGGGVLRVTQIQMPGKKRVAVKEYLKGNSIEIGTVLR